MANHDNHGKPVPEWQAFLDFNVARAVGSGSDANHNSSVCKAPVRSPPPEYQHSVFWRLDALSTAQQPTVSKH